MIELVARALDQAGTVVAKVAPEQAGLPTPCAEWDVRRLVRHLVDEVARFAESTATGQRGTSEGDVLGDDWAAAFQHAAAALLAAWRAPGALDRTTRLPGGEVPASWTLGQHVTEIAVHTWDIATATGQPTDLDPAVGAAALEWAHANLVPEIRGEHVGPEVAIAADAPLYDRLAAFGGRVA
ncbi:MAG: TIGR03086 family metal-binding protein [Actinophytocola sp.]|uniref:TIGR03086 family metal-binding protein n=1 Tax=Actinophytocola sp. TaxID=1872138 RepID=UPI003C7962B0